MNQKRFYVVFSGEVAMNGAQTAVMRRLGERVDLADRSALARPLTAARRLAIGDQFALDGCRAR